MRRGDRDFVERLRIGPSFLFLGQATWALQDLFDPVLAAIPSLGKPDGTLADPRQGHAHLVDDYRRLRDVSRAAALPAVLAAPAELPWNGVITTTIDVRITRLFHAEWRRVATMVGLDGDRSPRSPSELTIRMLFGGVQLADDQHPPADALEFAVADQRARATLSYVADELITPRGVLAIEGYRPEVDWLGPDALFAFLDRLQPGQAHMFSVPEDDLSNPFLRAAVERSMLVIHHESLSSLLAALPPDTPDRLRRRGEPSDRIVRIGGEIVDLPADLWNSTITSARPVDESAIRPLGNASESRRYLQFRAFMGATAGPPDWPAIASGFNFKRDFEKDLWARIEQDAADPDLREPLVLEGQTASGKSIALAAAAVRAARAGRLATLFVATQSTRLQSGAVDRYAKWAQEHGAPATLLLWDGMTDPDDYFEVHRQLKSRGRRVAIIGTSYVSPQNRSRLRRVKAPSRLTEEEAQTLGPWLSAFGVELSRKSLHFIANHPTFLGVLYHLLPDSRRKVREGLSLELRTAESDMEKLAREKRRTSESAASEMTAMAHALAAAGVALPDFLPPQDRRDVGELELHERSTAEQLSAIVMVAGRRNLRVPLELVLRVVGRDGASVVVDVVKQFDIIRWSDDENGDQFLGARNALEAELLAQADVQDSRREIDVICSLLRNIRPQPGPGGTEVDFAVDLLTRIGPDSPDEARFIPYYCSVTDALGELRQTPGRTHERLVLYEANFARKWVMWSQDRKQEEESVRLDRLVAAAELLGQTLPGVTHRRTRLNLLVEYASVLGAQAYELSMVGAADSDLRRIAARIVELTNEARTIDPENYYPIDVVAWVVLRLVGGGHISGEGSVDLAADALASIVGLESKQLSQSQQAKYDTRLSQLASLVGNDALASEQLDRLAENQDPAAYFLLALLQSGLLAKKVDLEGVRASLERLRTAPTTVRHDWRCARLLLDLFWLNRTGQRFLQGEREVLPFSRRDWEECLEVTDLARGVAGFDQYRVDFLRGLAYFHLGQLKQARSAFEQLDRDTGFLSRRVITTYLMADAGGNPRRFTGQVRSIRPDASRGSVWVEELGTELPFFPQRFNIEGLRPNALLPDFWIGFNMRGPYADPIRSTFSHVSGGKR